MKTDNYYMGSIKTLYNAIHCLCAALLFFSMNHAHAQESQQILAPKNITELSIMPEDIRLETAKNGGWDLYVRKKEGLESILLTETTRGSDPQATNYSYRAKEYNSVNGDEIRLLDGEVLKSEYSRYSLVDSTAQSDDFFGQSFHIYIPTTLLYGYPWSRNGEIPIGLGTFVNIRGFEKKYADYTGTFEDNPYMFDFIAPPKIEEPIVEEPEIEVPKPILTNIYSSKAVEAFDEISNGMMIYSKGPETIVEDVMKSFNEIPKNKPADVVFAIDATGSMWDDIDRLKKELVPALTEELKTRYDVRLGLLFYRDFSDNFRFQGLPVQLSPFTENENVFFSKLNNMSIRQGSFLGGDIPEAVYEALYASMRYYTWNKDSNKKIILIGDAEPHESPRGVYGVSKETVDEMSKMYDITIDCIITPNR